MDQQSVYTVRQQHQQTQFWTRTFILTCVIACIMLAVFAADLFIAARTVALNDAPEKINPNTAPAASLIRLPGIGKAKALDIIHYRDAQADRPVFASAYDMENIRGIGPKTADKLKPYLTFGPLKAEKDTRQ